MKLMKCADGLRSAIGYSEEKKKCGIYWAKLVRLFIICCLFKDAIGKTGNQYTASNEWMAG
jgi:hypothetical protein